MGRRPVVFPASGHGAQLAVQVRRFGEAWSVACAAPRVRGPHAVPGVHDVARRRSARATSPASRPPSCPAAPAPFSDLVYGFVAMAIKFGEATSAGSVRMGRRSCRARCITCATPEARARRVRATPSPRSPRPVHPAELDRARRQQCLRFRRCRRVVVAVLTWLVIIGGIVDGRGREALASRSASTSSRPDRHSFNAARSPACSRSSSARR
jgi:hypothetical protein